MRFILCYILEKKQVLEEIIGEDAMNIRVSEICEETDLTDDDIMVFDEDQQW